MATTRYRCTGCGNLTRFDVTVTRRTRAYHHYSLGGELQIDDFELLSEDVESVTCRWCGTSGNVVEHVEDAPDTDTEPDTDPDSASGPSDAVSRSAGDAT